MKKLTGIGMSLGAIGALVMAYAVLWGIGLADFYPLPGFAPVDMLGIGFVVSLIGFVLYHATAEYYLSP